MSTLKVTIAEDLGASSRIGFHLWNDLNEPRRSIFLARLPIGYQMPGRVGLRARGRDVGVVSPAAKSSSLVLLEIRRPKQQFSPAVDMRLCRRPYFRGRLAIEG